MKTIFTTILCTSLLALSNVSSAVTVQETFIPDSTTTAEYTVTNDSAQDIYAFAVGNDTATETWTTIKVWNTYIVSEYNWNNDAVTLNFDDGSVSTSSIGVFSDLFAGSAYALLYTYDAGLIEIGNGPNWSPIYSGTTIGGFMFTTEQLASSFVAIDGAGGIVAQGEARHTSAVPVPAAVWLFGSGLIGLAWLGLPVGTHS